MEKIINDKIEYWRDFWQNLIENFLKKSYGLNLYNPHILLEDIIIEIEENNFGNGDNRKYFQDKLNEYFENDIVLKKLFHSDFKYLRQILNDPSKNNLIYQICKNILQKFKNGLYFSENINNLTTILLDLTPLDENLKSINLYTENIIIEFIKKGYSLKDIHKFISKIYDGYKYMDTGKEIILVTDFPHNISYLDFQEEGILNRAKFNLEISKLIDNIKPEQRIKSLKFFYEKKVSEAYYIFVVEGLRGANGFNIGDVEFYCPTKKRFAKEDEFNDEILQDDKDNIYYQAAVKVNYISSESSLPTAISTLQNTIDLLHTFYNTKVEIQINSSKYVVIQEGKIISTSWSNEGKDFFKFHQSLFADRLTKSLNELDKFKFLFSNSENNKTTSRLLNAIHWYSKAENSNKPEDKLLNYWISIENIINSESNKIQNDIITKNNKKIALIQSIVSSSYIFNYLYDFGWEYYNYYSHIVRNKHLKKIDLPEKLIEKANLILKEGDTIYLEKFIDSLSEIKEYETNIFLIEKIENLITFYNNNEYASSIIKKQIKKIEDDLLMTYRYRNLIVHNAHFDNALLPYYIWKIREYAGNFIRRIIYDYEKTKNDLGSLLINIFIEKEKLLIDLKDNKAVLFKN